MNEVLARNRRTNFVRPAVLILPSPVIPGIPHPLRGVCDDRQNNNERKYFIRPNEKRVIKMFLRRNSFGPIITPKNKKQILWCLNKSGFVPRTNDSLGVRCFITVADKRPVVWLVRRSIKRIASLE